MQPLNTMVKPSIESVIGCLATGDGSMIASRRCPRATEPDDQTPQSSGPRGVSASVIRATAATSAVASSKRISPAMPHMTERSGDHAQLVEGRIVRALEKHALADTLLEEVDDHLGDPLPWDEHGHARWIRAHRFGCDLTDGVAELDVLRVAHEGVPRAEDVVGSVEQLVGPRH